MKRSIRSILLLILTLIMLICLALPAYAQNYAPKTNVSEKATEITEAGVSGNLNKDTDTRWYSFPVTIEGDAVIMFSADGGSTQVANWEIFIYDQDKTTVLAKQYARKGITYVSAQNLSKGTYYFQVQSAKSASTFKFSSKKFSINAITCTAEQINNSSGELCTVTKPGTVLWQVDGTIFIKALEGEALVGSYTSKSGKTGPILIGKDAESVSFFSSKSNGITYGHKESYVRYGEGYDTERYFISTDRGFVTLPKDAPLSAPFYQCGNGRKISAEHAAKELLNVHFGKDPNEGLAWENFMASPAFPIIAVAVVLVIMAIIVIVYICSKKNSHNHTHRAQGHTPSSTPTTTSADNSGADWNGLPHVVDYNSVKDM